MIHFSTKAASSDYKVSDGYVVELHINADSPAPINPKKASFNLSEYEEALAKFDEYVKEVKNNSEAVKLYFSDRNEFNKRYRGQEKVYFTDTPANRAAHDTLTWRFQVPDTRITVCLRKSGLVDILNSYDFSDDGRDSTNENSSKSQNSAPKEYTLIYFVNDKLARTSISQNRAFTSYDTALKYFDTYVSDIKSMDSGMIHDYLKNPSKFTSRSSLTDIDSPERRKSQDELYYGIDCYDTAGNKTRAVVSLGLEYYHRTKNLV